MDFHEYLAAEDALSLTALAERIGVSIGRLSQLKKSGGWTADLAMDIEAATGGKIDAARLSPTVARARGHLPVAA